MGEEMKVVLVSVLVLLAAASVVAYGNLAVASGMTAAVHAAGHTSEPAALLLSGSLLLGLAGAVKRFTL